MEVSDLAGGVPERVEQLELRPVAASDRHEVVVEGQLQELEREDRAAMLERDCLADSELRLRVEALLEAHNQINDSLKQPRVGSDDRDEPWLARRSLALAPLRNLAAGVPRSVRLSYGR
jgi:hypothetical protein